MDAPSLMTPLLVGALRDLLGPEKVLSDNAARKAYSYDAGIHKITPGAVVFPEDASDLSKIAVFSKESGVPLTARSAGTNLTGASIGPGLVVATGRMTGMDLSGAEGGTVRVGPGVILKELADRLAEIGYFFPPDPSSAQACQIGGMIGTNAAGAHALKYGAMKDNVRALDIVDADGGRHRLAPVSFRRREDLNALLTMEPFRKVAEKLPDWAPVLLSRMKHVSKNSSGYNLFDLAAAWSAASEENGGTFDPVRLFIGSEGTLGLVSEATLRVLPLPARKVTILAFFLDLEDLGEAVGEILPLAPSALEMMDRATLDLIGRDRFGIPGAADSLLLIEFDHEPQEELVFRTETILSRFSAPVPPRVATTPEDQRSLWKARHSLFPSLYRYDGIHRPINFADDVAVPVGRLTELLGFLRDLFAREKIKVAVYGHIGNGNAHINPLLDVRETGTPERLLSLSRAIHTAAIERFGGVPCGEHGEGRVRAEFLPMVYGPEVYEMFRQVKGFFDPDGRLNPGVKISRTSFIENLDLERVAKPCATCGKCNTVCPSFDVTRSESEGARGWYQILTDPAFSGRIPDAVLDSCLNCKSCRSTCPAGVDVSRVILDARARRGGDILSERVFSALLDGSLDRIVPFLGKTQPLWDRPLLRRLLERASRILLRPVSKTALLPRDLRLPRIAKRLLRDRFRSLTEEGGRTGDLAYFHGCAAQFFDDGIGESVIRLLGSSSRRLVLPAQTCSGTPIETYGHADLTRKAALFNLSSLEPYPVIVAGCASCTLALRDLPDLFDPGSELRERATRVAGRVRHISQYMLDAEMAPALELAKNHYRRSPLAGGVTYHESCHLRAAGITEEPHRLIDQVFGSSSRPMPDSDRCAGGAGSFLIKNPELSDAIFERKRKGVAASGAGTVTTGCPACQLKLRDGLNAPIEVWHLANLLARALPDHIAL